MSTVEPEDTSITLIAVLKERLSHQTEAQQQILSRLDEIIRKFDGLPDVYYTRNEATTLATSTALIQSDLSRRLDLLDARADALKLWLIGALGAGLVSLALQALPHAAALPK